MEGTEAKVIADLAVEANGAAILEGPDSRRFLLYPKGFRAREVSDPHGLKLTRPRYIDEDVTLQTRDSLVEYAKRFKTDESMLFADMSGSTLYAVLDWHGKSDGAGTPGTANHVRHIAVTLLPFSEQWKTWAGISGKLMPQLDFARFLEENGADINAPDAADLLEACRDLQAKRKVNFTKAVRTASENENFEYTDETNLSDRGGIEVPSKFQLALPVYFGEPNTPLMAFLRWKLGENGQLHLGVQLHRAEHVRQAVFKAIVTEVAERTLLPTVYGIPRTDGSRSRYVPCGAPVIDDEDDEDE